MFGHKISELEGPSLERAGVRSCDVTTSKGGLLPLSDARRRRFMATGRVSAGFLSRHVRLLLPLRSVAPREYHALEIGVVTGEREHAIVLRLRDRFFWYIYYLFREILVNIYLGWIQNSFCDFKEFCT